jgi:hypothetical protein
MTSIVIPYKYSHASEVQLRYALRSIEKHLKGYGEVFLLGKAPTWCQNLVEVPTPDIDRNFDKIYQKERAIYEKVRLACYLPEISNTFYFTNDDHYLLTDFDAGKFPLYWSGDWEEQAERPDIYRETAKNTLAELRNRNLSDILYDCHTPILYNKKKFLKLEGLDWNKKYGYGIKTMYAALNGLQGELIHDLKLRVDISITFIKCCLLGKKVFSTDDKAMGPGVISVLKELYPNKSKYEK